MTACCQDESRDLDRAFGEERAKALRATLHYIAAPEFAQRVDDKSSPRQV